MFTFVRKRKHNYKQNQLKNPNKQNKHAYMKKSINEIKKKKNTFIIYSPITEFIYENFTL